MPACPVPPPPPPTFASELPKVRDAHFATHGYFDDKDLTEERKHLKKSLETVGIPAEAARGSAARVRPNPAGYIGLVLAGANDPAKDDKDRRHPDRPAQSSICRWKTCTCAS